MRLTYIILFLFLFVLPLSFSQELSWGETVNLTGLNTEKDEFAPVWNRFQGQLYFNSTISGYSKFYISNPDNNFEFHDFQLVEGEINAPRNNQSYITFESNDIAYISSFRQFNERSYMNIFQTRKKKNSWLLQFDADSLIYPQFMAHPTVSPDGKVLIFSSTLNSGFGDTDLWMAMKQENGTWGSLIQISSLKTPGNEITPHLASNDTLYFASDGQEGPGGYDLFMSVRKDGTWQIPYPLASLNTEFDESDFTLLPNDKAIFASNKPGGNGGLDLYLTSLGKPKIKETLISPIDFSIAAQVPNIKVLGDITEVIAPVFTYFFFEKDKFLNSDFIFKDKLFTNNPDSIHLFSPFIIAERIRHLKEHKLFITIYENEINTVEQEIIKKKLLDLFQLNDDRIVVNFVMLNETMKSQLDKNVSYMKFTSNNDNVFNPVDIGAYKIETIPPALELLIDARPRTIIKRWECKLSCGLNYEKTIRTGKGLPEKFFHNILDLSKELIDNDSIVITLTAEDTLDRKHVFNQVFNVSHSSSRQIKSITYKNKKFIEYYILLTDIRELKEGNSLTKTFRTIAENAIEKKNIVIRRYSDYGKQMTNGIKELIAEQVGGKDLNIIIENEIKKDGFSNKPYGKFLFSILVEI